MTKRIRWHREITVDAFGFINDYDLRVRLDEVAEAWGCPNTDDPYWRYTGARGHYDAHFILHYTRKRCTDIRYSGGDVLCVRVPLNGTKRNVYMTEHGYNCCKWRLPDKPY
jgi:hypothetical protein